jgi:hypothetical protein
MMRKILLSSLSGALTFGLLAAAAQAAPGQFPTLDKSQQTNDNLLTLVRGGGHGGGGGHGHGGGHGGGRGGGHWGGGRGFAGGGWGGGRHRFHHGFRGRGFAGYYGIDDDYGYGNGCFWRYGRWICPGYGGYDY